MKTSNRIVSLLTALVSLTAWLAAPAAFAANWAWSTSPVSANFSDPNWTNGTVAGPALGTPSSGDSLFFGTSSQLSPNNDDTGFTFGGLTFNSGASTFAIGGNAFTLAGGITNSATTVPIINNNFTLGGNETIAANSGAMTFNGIIDDAGSGYGLTFSGGKNVTLNGINTYSGPTLFLAGNQTLILNGSGSVPNSSITLGQAGSPSAVYFDIGSATQPAGGLVIASNLIVTASILGGGNFNNINTAAPTVNVTNIFTGTLQLNTGLLRQNMNPNASANMQYQFNSFSRQPGTVWSMDRGTAPGINPIANQTAAAVNIVFVNPPALVGAGGAAGTTTVGIVPGIFTGGNATYDSTYGLRGLTAAEQAALVSGMTTPSQNAIVNANTTLTSSSEVNALQLNGSFTVTLGGNTLTVDSGEISDGINGVIGSAANDGFLALGAEGIFNVANARNLTINSVITGTSGLTINLDDYNGTTAYVALAGTNTFSGVTRVLANASMTLKINNSLALQNSTLDYNNYGGTVTFGTATSTLGGLKGAQNLALPSTSLTIGSAVDSDNTTYSGVLSGTGSLIKAGAGALTLSGASTYSGGTTISSGQLNINYGGSSSANSAIGTAALTIVGGAIDNTSGSTVTLLSANAQNWNGDFTFVGTGNLNLGTGLVTLGSSRQVTVNASTLTVSGAISGSGFGLTKNGNGTLALSGATTFSGNTTINGGTLALTGGGSISSSPIITVAGGATLDVSGVSFTLGGSQSLQGSGTNNGSVNTTSGSTLYAGTDGTYGTNTFNNNLTLASGAAAYFDLGTAATGSNDKIVVAGTLTLNGNTIYIKAPSTGVNLAAGDYTLFTVNGSISGSFAVTPTWDVQPLNFANYSIVTSGNTVKLHYTAVSNPVGSGSANPNPVARNQSTVITVTVTTPGSAPVSTVTVNASPIGGASSVTLVEVGATSAYTNTVTVGASIAAGSTPLTATITDSDGGNASVMVPLTVLAGTVTWNGNSGSDNNWTDTANWVGGVSPLVGDAAIFAGTVRLTPVMDNSFTLNSLTFSNNAGGFIITNNPGDVLTLNGGGVTNNSPNAQALNLPIVMSTSQTFYTTAGSLALGGGISGASASLTKSGSGANSLTLSGANTYGGGTIVNAGTVVVANNSALGSGTLTLNSGSISNLAGSSFSVANGVTVASAANVGVGSGDTFTLAGTISGGGNLTLVGGGTLVLPNANNNSGGVTISTGTLVVANNSAVGSGLLTLGNGSISNSAGSSYAVANPVNLTGAANVVVGTGDTFMLSGTITNTGSLALVGSGAVSVPGNNVNTYSGGTTLAAGTLIDGNTSGSPFGSGTLTLAGGILADSGSAALTLSNNIMVVTNTTSYLNPTAYNGNGLTLNGNISGPGNIVVNGSGSTYDSFCLNGTNSGFTGTLTVNSSGFQRFAFINSNAGSSNASFVFNSAGVDQTKIVIGSGTNTIAFGSLAGVGWLRNDSYPSVAILRVGDLNTSTAFNGLITAAGGAGTLSLLKVGTGTLTMTNNNTYNGPTEVAGGTLDISVAQGSSTSYQVDDGATLGIINYPGSGLFVGQPSGITSLTVGSSTGAALLFTNLDSSSSYGPIVAVNFTNNGTCTIKITDTNNLVAGNTYQLIGYGTYASSGAGNFVLSSPYVQGNLVNDPGNGELYLTVTGFSSVNPNPTNITVSVSGGNLSLAWPGDHLGWYLQAQTNSLSTGLGTNWVDVPGSSTVTNVVVPIDPNSPAVFYRMSLQP